MGWGGVGGVPRAAVAKVGGPQVRWWVGLGWVELGEEAACAV